MEEKKSILCVGDNRDFNSILQHSLKELYDVTLAASYNNAVEHLDNKKFEVVITDVEIGNGGNGYDLIKWIRKNVSLTMSVIICSASAFKRDKSEAYEAGADYFLVKPIQNIELLNAVDTMIKGKSF
jgi:CheY-like chemotaxis protein